MRNRKYNKLSLMFFALLSVVLLAGCRMDSEVWLNRDGSGNGVVKFIGIPVPLETIRQEASKHLKDFTVDYENGVPVVKFKFKTIDEFNERATIKKTADGLTEVYMGWYRDGTLIVHVDGDIDKEKTKRGRILDSSTISFAQSNVLFYYKPKFAFARYLYMALIALGVVAAGAVLYRFVMRKPKGTSSPSSNKAKYCRECGAPLSPGDAFCGECGKRLD